MCVRERNRDWKFTLDTLAIGKENNNFYLNNHGFRKICQNYEKMVVLTVLNNKNNIKNNSLILYFPFSFNT